MIRILISSSVAGDTRCALIKSDRLVEVQYSDYHFALLKSSIDPLKELIININWDDPEMDEPGIAHLLACAGVFVLDNKEILCL